MSTTASPASAMEQLETAILADVVTRFANLKESTSRFSLLVKFEGLPAWQAIGNLASRNMIRKSDFNQPTDEEEYLPTAPAFEFCGDPELKRKAKNATTVVLHTLKQMFKGERRKKDGFTFEDFQRHVKDLYPNRTFEASELKLGLYLAKDFNVLSAFGSDVKEVGQFRIAETAIGMANPETEWDRVMSVLSPRQRISEESSPPLPSRQWEKIKPLGGGGQSDVFLVRSPERVSERAACLQKIRTAVHGDQHADLADATWLYSRPDSLSELGAMKVFKIRDDSSEQQALDRLKQEFEILKQSRPGLPKLLDSNESERWIVTELFANGTLEDNILRYKGKPALALKAFLSLVNTVAQLHDEGIVRRDIKPANVFVEQDDELVLGDFGIVFVPDQPARLTRTNESVGPHDYMPPWADTGGRLEKVNCNFDVYMLGKLLWCMVSGRLVLRREWFRQPQNDISLIFRDDPHAYMINTILEKCVVERQQDCVGIHDLRAMVIAFVGLIEQGGQLLQDEVPRPCHVCGAGTYQPELFRQSNPAFNLRLWNLSGGANDINSETVRLFVCSSCGHIEFFKTSPR
jgi:serine/threonine protein kinase